MIGMLMAAWTITQAEPPPPPLPPQVPVVRDVRSWRPDKAIMDGSAHCGDCRLRTERFLVEREHHTGYNLYAPDQPYSSLRTVFTKDGAADQFHALLSRAPIGWRTYCDCTGRLYETVAGGPVIFQVLHARLFFRREKPF